MSKQSDHQVKLTNIPLPCKLYSLLHNKITNIKLDKASAEQWVGTLNNLCSNGLTKDELEYTEIKQWLTKQNSPIQKLELLKKIEQSLPEIKIYQEIKTEPIPLNFIPCGWLLSEERTKMMDKMRERFGGRGPGGGSGKGRGSGGGSKRRP